MNNTINCSEIVNQHDEKFVPTTTPATHTRISFGESRDLSQLCNRMTSQFLRFLFFRLQRFFEDKNTSFHKDERRSDDEVRNVRLDQRGGRKIGNSLLKFFNTSSRICKIFHFPFRYFIVLDSRQRRNLAATRFRRVLLQKKKTQFPHTDFTF